jgi:hypothetical protein
MGLSASTKDLDLDLDLDRYNVMWRSCAVYVHVQECTRHPGQARLQYHSLLHLKLSRSNPSSQRLGSGTEGINHLVENVRAPLRDIVLSPCAEVILGQLPCARYLNAVSPSVEGVPGRWLLEQILPIESRVIESSFPDISRLMSREPRMCIRFRIKCIRTHLMLP